jgi:hypothetical protein
LESGRARKGLARSTRVLSAMSSEIYYRQCGFKQVFPPGAGARFDVAWLPEKLAKVGEIFYLGKKREDVPPEEKWVVTWAGDNRRSLSELVDKQNADKHQREKSDV